MKTCKDCINWGTPFMLGKSEYGTCNMLKNNHNIILSLDRKSLMATRSEFGCNQIKPKAIEVLCQNCAFYRYTRLDWPCAECVDHKKFIPGNKNK